MNLNGSTGGIGPVHSHVAPWEGLWQGQEEVDTGPHSQKHNSSHRSEAPPDNQLGGGEQCPGVPTAPALDPRPIPCPTGTFLTVCTHRGVAIHWLERVIVKVYFITGLNMIAICKITW